MANEKYYLSDVGGYLQNIERMRNRPNLANVKELIATIYEMEGAQKETFIASECNTILLSIILEVYFRALQIQEFTSEEIFSLMKSLVEIILIDRETSEIVGFAISNENDFLEGLLVECNRVYWMLRALGILKPTVKDINM